MFPPPDSDIPSIPGQLLWGNDAYAVRLRVTELTRTAPARFPGAQPISFNRTVSLPQLMHQDFMVCEKSDGVRVLVLMIIDQRDSMYRTFMLTRKNEVYFIPGVLFPAPIKTKPQAYHDGTLIDAELVIDTEPDGRRVRRLLGFDALAVAGANCMDRILDKRLGYLKDHVMLPFIDMCAHMPAEKRAALPFLAEMKHFERSYGVTRLYDTVIPTLKHKSDGLIFTSINAPYTAGTCDSIFKWKPSNENSVDFKVKVSLMADGSPSIQLLAVKRAGAYTYFDNLAMRPGDWDRLFKPIKDLDGRIIEVVYDPEYAPPFTWRFMRFRDDKEIPNYYRVVVSVKESINDNISLDELKKSTKEMRIMWKKRHNEPL
ncbi:Dcp1p-Dcp2p decapping enzyme complex alpha subunit [Coemansia sp. RSA 1813]|nr:Dcp1p-Dcp2p decapping enzyme complex alpha subunit [Coemansia sp. RSA 1646]KAJ1767991.1 Dcp1p-Dcp2p decapping enzyme complex alpha subunit [Coemansia sp. RSA 1843]KAJ2086427.1 Dcp1p-Dcp2p decapping enzyme complex alpha subunit [Coemansia sp. RSA 986]KAJ2211235.1 Dcp1p-Dcp2p decapping enzyme complex alpha subunit [Coemansia sp. RSA 487]KAJ2564481.1 Dcp1p-Dcp2p decapping enzyme complex alpha subunit [Coemansia sp. RSA 1813]